MASSQTRRERLLGQLTRMRQIEHRAAVGMAAEALEAAQRSQQLADRAQALADGYHNLQSVQTAHDLAGQFLSGARMRTIAADVSREATQAQDVAQIRLGEERRAKRKLDQLEEKRAEMSAAQRRENDARSASGPQLARNVNSAFASNREA